MSFLLHIAQDLNAELYMWKPLWSGYIGRSAHGHIYYTDDNRDCKSGDKIQCPKYIL